MTRVLVVSDSAAGAYIRRAMPDTAVIEVPARARFATSTILGDPWASFEDLFSQLSIEADLQRSLDQEASLRRLRQFAAARVRPGRPPTQARHRAAYHPAPRRPGYRTPRSR